MDKIVADLINVKKQYILQVLYLFLLKYMIGMNVLVKYKKNIK